MHVHVRRDRQHAKFWLAPGVRSTITDGDHSREAITDSKGRFVLRSMTMGTYRVVAELAAFIPTSGQVELSASSPRAFLAWPLEVGCLDEDLRVSLVARKAAALVDAILHYWSHLRTVPC